MRYLLCALVLFTLPVAVSRADPPAQPPSALSAAPYLLPGSPTFDLTITQFREKFNIDNPNLPLGEFRAIDTSRDKANLTRAASKINENLYASTALERGTLKIKSIQMTWLPIQGPEQKAARAKAMEYMAAMLRSFTPTFSKQQSQERLNKLFTAGKNKRYFAQTEGAIRYVVADNGEKGLTFAVEPIKLTLSESLNNGD
ncbi:YiiQ family protein [Dryocola sp. BD626]|uniref:YiiQ family protein n=1 Tax=Dryocola sp. BD626 TaxID=3133273 RepID=UPI003F504477